jgi:hypothetical protein
VPESPLETERVRKVDIYFYLEDGSIQIVEHKLGNSGMPQGDLVRGGGPNPLRFSFSIFLAGIYSSGGRQHPDRGRPGAIQGRVDSLHGLFSCGI